MYLTNNGIHIKPNPQTLTFLRYVSTHSQKLENTYTIIGEKFISKAEQPNMLKSAQSGQNLYYTDTKLCSR